MLFILLGKTTVVNELQLLKSINPTPFHDSPELYLRTISIPSGTFIEVKDVQFAKEINGA